MSICHLLVEFRRFSGKTLAGSMMTVENWTKSENSGMFITA